VRAPPIGLRCSSPVPFRVELTRLSYAIPHHDPGISSLNGILENRERCQMLLKMLEAGRVDLTALRPSDRAAASRMLELLRDPHRILEDIRGHATSAFRRLYRQRNFVLHWGKTDGVALRASLRTAAPLVGAGIDRIVHADYVDRLSPLQLVARAKTALATVGSPAGPACAELLG
jgi:hypothetical protein